MNSFLKEHEVILSILIIDIVVRRGFKGYFELDRSMDAPGFPIFKV
jgi:hypothetical protein